MACPRRPVKGNRPPCLILCLYKRTCRVQHLHQSSSHLSSVVYLMAHGDRKKERKIIMLHYKLSAMQTSFQKSLKIVFKNWESRPILWRRCPYRACCTFLQGLWDPYVILLYLFLRCLAMSAFLHITICCMFIQKVTVPTHKE